MRTISFDSLLLIVLSLAFLWNIPSAIGAPILGNIVPKNFEVNAMAVDSHGDVAAGSFYAMDPTVIPWDLTKPIYKDVGVTLIVSNLNASTIASTVGINIPTQLTTLLPFKVVLIIQGVQTNAPAIASDIQSVFGMQSPFVALASSILTLPVSVYAADVPSGQYSNFVSKFVQSTSNKAVVIGQYTASLLERSSSGIVFNSVESLTYPTSPLFSAGSLNSAILGSTFDTAFGLNSTGVIVLQKNKLDFSQPQDHTLDFSTVLGFTSPLKSTTNETFATVLPSGAQLKSFTPSTMLVQSSNPVTLVVGLFPWVGSTQRTLPDISVTFHYPAFDSPVLSASWTTNPTSFNVGDNFTLSLTLTNTGAMDAQNISVDLGFTGLSWAQLAAGRSQNSNIQYNIPSIPKGGSNTTNLGKFLSYVPETAFSLTTSYLDPQSFAYTWSTFFSIAANVQTNGPLVVTKIVTPTNPVLGQNGTVTVTIHNTDNVDQYANMLDTTPEAITFLYPNGPYPSSSSSKGFCPDFYDLNANLTYFTFQFYDYCGSNVVTGVSIKNPTSFLSVATPNIPLNQYEQWAPLYRYPTGFSPAVNTPVTVMLTFQNSQQVSTSSNVYNFTLPQLGDPNASYLTLKCSFSPCNIFKNGGAPTLSGVLVDTYGNPISGATVQLGYTSYSNFYNNSTSNTLATLTTSSSGTYNYLWGNAPQLSAGSYQLTANYAGVAGHSKRGEYLEAYVLWPFFIGPGQTVTMSYPYFFNATGPLTIEPERITYSTRFNVTFSCGPSCTNSVPIIGQFESESSPVTVNVQAPIIHPIVETTMNTQKLSFFYLAQNRSLVKINLRVTNAGTQPATNVVVSATIPRQYQPYSSYPGLQLPVADNGNVTVDKVHGVVTFNVATLGPGQAASAWYVVQANSTNYQNLYQTASNVTAQANGSTFKFSYTGALLGIYFPPTYSQPPAQGLLQSYVTVDPPAIANGTSTTVTLHLFNAGNVTYTSINATLGGYNTGQLSFDKTSKRVPDMAPGTGQTVTFTATANRNPSYYSGNWTDVYFSGYVNYNQSSARNYSDYFSGSLQIYNGKAGFSPSVRLDVSMLAPTVSAGALDIVVVTVSNIGTTSISNFGFGLQSNGPLGTSGTEISYGNLNNKWPGDIAPSQTIKFRVGIQTRAGGLYHVFANYANYNFKLPAGQSCGYYYCSNYAQISGSTAAEITATQTVGPAVTMPWASPFAPTSSDTENVWTQVSDQSGLASVNLEYSTDKSTWKSIIMTPLIGPYLTGQNILQLQSTIGDIYNATIPAENGGTTVFYRIRATDRLGNPTLQDNNGIDFSYTVQGSNSAVVQVPPGTNVPINITQTNPNIGIKATITLTVSAPISIQVTKLSANPGGSPPTGTSPLGIYLQINANVSITLQARIRIYYTASQVQGLNVSSVAPYYWDGTNWVALGNVVVNTSEMWVEGTVTHFSLFGLFASAAQQPPPQPNPTSQPPWLIIGIVAAVVVVAAVGGFYGTRMRKRGRTNLPGSESASTPGPPARASGCVGSEPRRWDLAQPLTTSFL